MKPVKAWAIRYRYPETPHAGYAIETVWTRNDAEAIVRMRQRGGEVVRVEIREITERKERT